MTQAKRHTGIGASVTRLEDFDSGGLNVPALGARPAVDVGGVLEFYSRHHIFARFDFVDLVVSYGSSGFGTRHQFQGAFGFGVWF